MGKEWVRVIEGVLYVRVYYSIHIGLKHALCIARQMASEIIRVIS